MNLEILKDAVARWQTYKDRGIKPLTNSLTDYHGNRCALGDIGYYSGLDVDVPPVGSEWKLIPILKTITGQEPYFADTIEELHCPIQMLALENNISGEWPIEQLQRIIEWEEAARAIDVQESPVCYA